MRVGIIGGTGASFEFPDLTRQTVETRYGSAEIELGRSRDGAEIAVLSRHGRGHERLSSHIDHRANVAALREVGVTAIIATTVCGVVDSSLETGWPILFDDLLFLDNRLPDGSPCSMFDTPGESGRGHYIFDRPFSPALRSALSCGADGAGIDFYERGVYGYMLGPRFNTKTEIGVLSAAQVAMVSQTAAPEAILAESSKSRMRLSALGPTMQTV